MGDLGEARMVEIPKQLLGNSRPGDCFMFSLGADTLTCRETSSKIPVGAYVIADVNRPAKPHETEVYYLPVENVGVLKSRVHENEPAEGYVVVESYDHKRAPITITEATPLLLRGTLVGYWVFSEDM
jgi:hypothetical protein